MQDGKEEKKPLGFASLAPVMFRTARTLSRQAKGAAGRDLYGLVMTAVILAQACTEAHLNEFLELQRIKNPQTWTSIIGGLERVPIANKYAIVATLVSGDAFDAGSEPCQSFLLLVALRNELVHYNPEFRPMGELPRKMLEGLKARFDFEYEGKADWTAQVLTGQCAEWACETARALLTRFHALVGNPSPWELAKPFTWDD